MNGKANTSERVAGAALLLVFVVWLYVGSYGTQFGERDAYRVFIGTWQALSHHSSFADPLVYGHSASPGYFWLLSHGLASSIDPSTLARVLNAVSAACGLVCLGAVFAITRRLATTRGALLAVAFLLITPVWFDGVAYAHPMWPAMAGVLSALVVQFCRPAGARGVAYDVGTVICLTIGFGCRLDAVLTMPFFLVLLPDFKRRSAAILVRLVVIAMIAVVLSKVIFDLGPASTSLAEPSNWMMLKSWHSPERFVTRLRPGLQYFLEAIGPFLAIAFGLATLHHLQHRRWNVLVPTVLTVLLNLIFWIPNPLPGRHFILCVAPLAISVAIALGGFIVRDRSRKLSWLALCGIVMLAIVFRHFWLLTLAGIALDVVLLMEIARRDPDAQRRGAIPSAIVLATLSLVVGAWVVRSPMLLLAFENPWPTAVARDLETRPLPLAEILRANGSVFVLGDAYPLVAHLVKTNPRVSDVVYVPELPNDDLSSLGSPSLDVTIDGRTVRFFVQSWIADDALASFDRFARGRPAVAIVDHRIAASSGLVLRARDGVTVVDY